MQYKEYSIVRKTDDLGRITIPREILSHYNLWGSELIISVEGDQIILEKYLCKYKCTFCENDMRVENVEYNGLRICKKCLNNIFRLYKDEIENSP